jgi:hypothetical protein
MDAVPASTALKLFTINGKLLQGQQDAQLTLQGPDDNQVNEAVLAGKPFPPGKLPLGSIRFAANTGNSIPFQSVGRGKVALNVSTNGFFNAGVYPDPADLLKDLSPTDDIAAGITLTKTNEASFLMLRCGYDASATGKGSVGLGTGASVNFGAAASRDATYAVIHRFGIHEIARAVLDQTIQGWILPSQFERPDLFPADTWMVVELDGSIALNLGVQAGYDYSWLRQIPDGTLKGDLGLKVQLAANAALGFSANGSFALAISRETEAEAIRLRLFKLSKNGWSFAFNASAGELVTLPDAFAQAKNIDGLISAVFGLHAAQLVQDLAEPGLTGTSDVAKFIAERGLIKLPGETDVEKLFAAGKADVDALVKDWNALTNKPATMLASILQTKGGISDLTQFLQELESIDPADQKGVQQLLSDALSKADFFQTPVGQWIESVVPTTSLAALVGSQDWSTVKKMSETALNVINGQTLQSLLDYAAKKLGLDQVAEALKSGRPETLEPWLQSKIAGFLGKDRNTKLTLDDLKKAQAALKWLTSNGEKFYDAARNTVQKKYEIEFTSTYQKTTSDTALLDATFDLTAGPQVANALRDAIDGDMQHLLLERIPGVTLAAATLTHDINRQAHSDLTMPFVDLSDSDVSDVLASVSPVEQNGRVLLYNLKAQDETKTHSGFFHASSEADSKLALVAALPVPLTYGVRRFSEPSISIGYTLAKATKALGTAQLVHDLKPLADVYMPDLFGNGKGDLGEWAKAVERQLATGKAGVLGEALFTLDVALPPSAFSPWFATSPNRKDSQYMAMSKAVQSFLRRVIPLYYFADPARYDSGPVADAVLAYSALPTANGFKTRGDGGMGRPDGDLYFGVDAEHLTTLIEMPEYGAALKPAMLGAHDALRPLGQADAEQYACDKRNIDRITQHALEEIQAPRTLSALLLFEYDLVRVIAKTGVQMAQFQAIAKARPADAVKNLAAFGDAFVQTFNHHLGGNLIAGPYLRLLGSALLLEAGRGLSRSAGLDGPAKAVFRLTILGNTLGLTLDDLLANNLRQAKVLIRETLVTAS